MKLEQIIKLKLNNFEIKLPKNEFVIPSPEGGESESDYMGRCISEISNEYEHDQAVAICIGKWQDK